MNYCRNRFVQNANEIIWTANFRGNGEISIRRGALKNAGVHLYTSNVILDLIFNFDIQESRFSIRTSLAR